MNINTFKIALRNAQRNLTMSIAKLTGISISFAVILFATGYVYFETSFDKHVPDHDKIYRCIMQGRISGSEESFTVTSPELARTAVNEIAEISETLRIRPGGEVYFHYNESFINGGQLLFADTDFFSFFGIGIQKILEIPFESPNHIAISRSLAEKHFGSVENALNSVVSLRDDECIITGVFDDFPDNFHLQFQTIQSLQKTNPEAIGWGSQSYYTYIKVNSKVNDKKALDFKLTKTVLSHWDVGVDVSNAQTWDDFKLSDEMYIFFISEPLTEIHFSNHKFDYSVTSSKTYVYGAVILSILVLLISSINFTNLTLANLTTRYREIGIRKTIGAFNKQITVQFFTESLIFWLVGFGIALLLYYIFGQPLGEYLNLDVNIAGKNIFKIVAFTLMTLLVFSILTNFLPVAIISKRNTFSLLKNDSAGNKSFSIKASFVFIQFILSALIILSATFVQKQIRFMVNKERGYVTENVIVISLWELAEENRKAFIDELCSHASVLGVSTSSEYFGEDLSMSGAFYEIQDENNYFHTSVLPIDHEFSRIFDFQILEGRFFDKNLQSDFDAVIINETASKEYSGNEPVVGKKLLINDGAFTILGVVKDFNFRSLHHRLQPLVLTRTENMGHVYIKTNVNQSSRVLDILQKQWEAYGITRPFSYRFHDEVIANHYEKDQQAKKLLLLLSVISILIACIGLYAISLFIIIRKTKEIGIRKVNGARVSEVLIMLNKDFIKWVAIAFVIATPIAYYVMNKWLQNFAYKTELSWWIFASAGAVALAVALLTVSWQSWRAARRNPVDALRYE